jgi:hypothetical protein
MEQLRFLKVYLKMPRWIPVQGYSMMQGEEDLVGERINKYFACIFVDLGKLVS